MHGSFEENADFGEVAHKGRRHCHRHGEVGAVMVISVSVQAAMASVFYLDIEAVMNEANDLAVSTAIDVRILPG